MYPESESETRPSADKLCFVISPIQQDDSEARIHADLVFKDLIEPAASKLGLKAERGDHQSDPGTIVHRIVQSVRQFGLLVCVLTDHNPNVLYELGISHSAARKVVLMIKKGQTRPFDLSHLRFFEYTLRPDMRKDQQERLAEMMREAKKEEKEQKERVLRYGVPMSTFGVEGLEPMGNDYFFARYFDHWKTVHLRDEYAPFIANAKRLTLTDPLPELFNPMLEAYLGGANVHAPLLIGAVLNNPLKGPQAAPDDAGGAMKKPPPRRVVRVILTSPTHPSAADGFDDGGSPIQVEALLMKTLDLWTQLAQRSKDDGSLSLIEITTVHTKLIRSHATMTEQGAYVLPRFYTAKQSSWNPCYFFNEATQFYRSLVADLEWLTKNYSAPDGRPRFSMLSMAEYFNTIGRAQEFVGLANPAFSLIHAAGVPTHLRAIENHDIVSLIHGLVRGLASKGRRIVVLLPAPRSTTFRALARLYDAQLVKEIEARLSSEIAAWRQLANDSGPSMRIALIENALLLDHVVITDRRALVTSFQRDIAETMLHAAGARWMVLGSGTSDYQRRLAELEALIGTGAPEQPNRQDGAAAEGA